MNNISGEPKPTGMNRRDFLKVAGAAGVAGVALLASIGGREYLRNIFEKDRKVDMSLFTLGIPGRDEKIINYSLFCMVFPELIAEEKDGFSFVNKDEKQLVLDFSNLAGEKIRLFPNKVDVAFANVSRKDAKKEKNYGEVNAGLICRGNFAIRGDVNRQPEFIGDFLHRSIMFIGNGTESCRVEDVKLSGLKSFHQSPEGDFNIPSPSYIAADDTNLEVNGIYIDHVVSKPDGINEVNAQLSKGISMHNTINRHPLILKIHASRVDGLEWDAIYTNGDARINIDKTALYQDRRYKHERGVAVGSTFNSSQGKITIKRSKIDYSKGIGIWTDSDERRTQSINFDAQECVSSVSSWCISLNPGQKGKFRHQTIITDWGDTPSADLSYWPVEAFFDNERIGLDFDTLEYEIDKSRTGLAKLMVYANFDNFDAFDNYGLTKFIQNNVDHFGDLAVNFDNEQFILSQKNLLKALEKIEKEHDNTLNPSGMILHFDLDKKLFIIKIATNYDAESGTIYFTDSFLVNQKGELIDNVQASKRTSIRHLTRKGMKHTKKLKFA